MATYYCAPKQILSYNGKVFTQPDSMERGNIAQSGYQVSSFSNLPPEPSFMRNISDVLSYPVDSDVLIYMAKNAQCSIWLTYNGMQGDDHRITGKIYYEGSLVHTFGPMNLRNYVASDNPNKKLGFMFFKEENYVAFIGLNLRGEYQTVTSQIYSVTIEELFEGQEITSDPYQTAPDSEPDGGYGDFDYSGDSILPPDLPTISVADSGFVTLYAPSITQLQSLAQYMWSGLFDVANFKKIFADPMDCIISLNILPVDLPSGNSQELKVGNIGTGITIDKLGSQFIKVMFEPLNIGVRTNSFMDFSPYVKAQLFLPFIGVRSLSIDEIAGADITIEYHIDLFSGACTAYVTIKRTNSDGSELKSSLYQFNGNICANIPFTATNYNGFLSSLLGTAAAVTTAIATQGSSSAVAGALSSGIDTATAIKPDVERSGNMSATNGFLGIQKPYLIVTYPHVCKPTSRDRTVGTPSFIGLSDDKQLSAFHGFTRLHKINVKGIPCTEDERQMIESSLLGEGVVLP